MNIKSKVVLTPCSAVSPLRGLYLKTGPKLFNFGLDTKDKSNESLLHMACSIPSLMTVVELQAEGTCNPFVVDSDDQLPFDRVCLEHLTTKKTIIAIEKRYARTRLRVLMDTEFESEWSDRLRMQPIESNSRKGQSTLRLEKQIYPNGKPAPNSSFVRNPQENFLAKRKLTVPTKPNRLKPLSRDSSTELGTPSQYSISAKTTTFVNSTVFRPLGSQNNLDNSIKSSKEINSSIIQSISRRGATKLLGAGNSVKDLNMKVRMNANTRFEPIIATLASLLKKMSTELSILSNFSSPHTSSHHLRNLCRLQYLFTQLANHPTTQDQCTLIDHNDVLKVLVPLIASMIWASVKMLSMGAKWVRCYSVGFEIVYRMLDIVRVIPGCYEIFKELCSDLASSVFKSMCFNKSKIEL